MGRAWGLVVAGLLLATSGLAKANTTHRAQHRRHPLWTERALFESPRTRALPDLVPLVRATWPSVVSITTTELAPAGDDALPGAEMSEAMEKGVGSGFVIRADGLIVTNAHVIAGARSISVAIDDGRKQVLPGEVVGVDPQSDVALLRVHAGRPLHALPLGDSEKVQVGQWVVAQGSPFGLAHTVSVGIISFVGRADVLPEGFTGFHDYLQTDTAINPGSSGGPLLDLRGRVVGIANSVNPSGQGIAFALPINMVKRVLPELLAHGQVRSSWMGVRVQDLDPALAESFGLGHRTGVVVTDLDERGPAARAGIHAGDVVLRFDGHKVRHAQHLRWLVEAAPTDRPVPVSVLRAGASRSVPVRLQPTPAEKASSEAIEQLGARFSQVEVPDARAAGLPLPNGARVAALLEQGPTVGTGLQVGDVITRAGARDVATPEDLAMALLGARQHALSLVIHRGHQVLKVQVGPMTAAR